MTFKRDDLRAVAAAAVIVQYCSKNASYCKSHCGPLRMRTACSLRTCCLRSFCTVHRSTGLTTSAYVVTVAGKGLVGFHITAKHMHYLVHTSLCSDMIHTSVPSPFQADNFTINESLQQVISLHLNIPDDRYLWRCGAQAHAE
jgi:hypothetical protein